jgi:cob(I)alamin adenosyltransferase
VRIYTRTGDAGETGLFAGGRVPKDHPRVAAYGDVDELNAALGMAMTLAPAADDRELLETIQRDLFTIGSELATPDPARLAQALSGRRVGEAHVAVLERAIDAQALALQLHPGAQNAASSALVCRRSERAVVRLAHEASVSTDILKYLNRLSDLLFVLARAANARAGVRDVTW